MNFSKIFGGWECGSKSEQKNYDFCRRRYFKKKKKILSLLGVLNALKSLKP